MKCKLTKAKVLLYESCFWNCRTAYKWNKCLVYDLWSAGHSEQKQDVMWLTEASSVPRFVIWSMLLWLQPISYCAHWPALKVHAHSSAPFIWALDLFFSWIYLLKMGCKFSLCNGILCSVISHTHVFFMALFKYSIHVYFVSWPLV